MRPALIFGPAVVLALLAAPSFAQQFAPEGQVPAGAAAPAQAADPGTQVGRLEQQIRDLQVMVGALESLVKANPNVTLSQEATAPSGPDFGSGGGLASRVDAVEVQLGALANQLDQMSRQLGALEARLNGGAMPPAEGPAPLAPLPGEEPLPTLPGRQGTAPEEPTGRALADSGGAANTALFRAEPAEEEETSWREQELAKRGSEEPQSLAALPLGVDAVSLYNKGYNDLVRRDYSSAETAFGQLVRGFPDDPLAGEAQYWLGETYYARGQYKAAADAFLKSYRNYQTGQKAPDSLLKLGITLAALGQKDAACSTIREFTARYPSADRHLLDVARSERRRVGC